MQAFKALTCVALLLSASSARAFDFREVGSFHVGGAGQIYVEYIKLAAPKARYPLLLGHGSGLTGVTYETKPDGEPGWLSFFLSAGHDVYVSDGIERGRAAWSLFPDVFNGAPIFGSRKEAWETLRIGAAGSYATDPAQRKALPGQLFPIDAFDAFAMQYVPRRVADDAQTQAAYNALVQKVCPCVILVHGQGGNFGYNAALAAPDKVKALIAIEPSGAPDPAKVNLASIKSIPHLIVWGDFVAQSDLWGKNRIRGSTNYHKAVTEAGGKSDWLSLPDKGVKGNTHMMMMDKNSDQVAGLINKWMADNGLMK